MSAMSKIDAYESEVFDAFEKGPLMSVATKAELVRLKTAARAMAGWTVQPKVKA